LPLLQTYEYHQARKILGSGAMSKRLLSLAGLTISGLLVTTMPSVSQESGANLCGLFTFLCGSPPPAPMADMTPAAPPPVHAPKPHKPKPKKPKPAAKQPDAPAAQ
jgi:hypothetical protein